METKKKKKKNHLPLRLNLLFLFVFVLFSILVLRLGVVQIVNGQNYKIQTEQKQHKTGTLAPARGIIYDSNLKVLVNNKAENAVVYTRSPGTTSLDDLKMARKLAKLLGPMSTSKITKRDKEDYWIAIHPNAYNLKLTTAETKKSNAYQILLNRITKADLKSISDPADMKILAIKRELDQAEDLQPTYIKVGITNKEMAMIGEHYSEFNGKITIGTASQRTYPNGNYFFLGQVGAIPADQVNEYVAKGYQLNDTVGTSFLEQKYEDLLRGQPTQYKYTTVGGQPLNTPQKIQGSRGDDLVLTINSDLQKAVGNILENNIKYDLKNFSSVDKGYFNSAYAIVINPKTGAIKAVCGRTLQSNGKFTDSSYGAIYNSFQIGSAVKGATVLTGYQHNAIPTSFHDMPFEMKGGTTFKSWTSSIGTVTPITALEQSSNIFMADVAARMAGFQVTSNGSYYNVRVDVGPQFQKAVNELRNGYSQFGLGVKTGVDLPTEATGYNGGMPPFGGNIFMFAIGQYDTYTPLQMAQYVSTIANGGYRIEPHFLDEVHAPTPYPGQLGPTIKKVEPTVLDKIPNPASQLKTVHQGFYMVTHGAKGTATMLGNGAYAKYKIAAKTGTAQVDTTINPNVYNLSLVSYAPYNNPQVAVIVMVPNTREEYSHLNSLIAEQIYDAYYKLKVK